MLLFRERRQYLAAVQDALAGADAARVVLEGAVRRMGVGERAQRPRWETFYSEKPASRPPSAAVAGSAMRSDSIRDRVTLSRATSRLDRLSV